MDILDRNTVFVYTPSNALKEQLHSFCLLRTGNTRGGQEWDKNWTY